jgi:hypothetical protein
MRTGLKNLFTLLLLTLGLSISAMAGNGADNYKLGGAWVAKVVDSPLPGQWSYVVVADPSGKNASGHGSVEIGFSTEAAFGYPYFEPEDTTSPLLVQVVKTGPDTASFYSIWYGLKELGPTSPVSHELVFIGISTGELKFVGPDKVHATHDFAFYYPSQDADGDGFPDEGETTPFVFQIKTVDTRLPLPH